MYTILISKTDDEIKETSNELCSGTEQVQILDNKIPPAHREYPFFRINTAKGIYNIPYSDILFVESGQKKSFIHLTNNTICLPLPLYRIREILPESFIIQTHRSFIVNLKKISYIDKTKDPWVISFFGSKKTAFISRSFKKDVMQVITPFLNYVVD